jgi:uncharacterized damage-inducible protein DinB
MPKSDDVQAVIDQLSGGPAVVRQLIYEMPPDLRKRRPAPGVWSAHEHAVHLPTIYPRINRRLDLMLSDPNPYIKSYEPSRDEPDGALLKLDLDSEMDRFDRERAVLVDRLRELPLEQWTITAAHEEYSQYGVYIMFRHIALHDIHHAYKIEDRLLRKNWD